MTGTNILDTDKLAYNILCQSPQGGNTTNIVCDSQSQDPDNRPEKYPITHGGAGQLIKVYFQLQFGF